MKAARNMRTLVIGKFPRCISDDVLGDAFGTVVGRSNIHLCRIAREKSGRSLCYAFIEFVDLAAAAKALEACARGDLVLLDDTAAAWQVTASRARRAARPIKSRAQAEQSAISNLMMRL